MPGAPLIVADLSDTQAVDAVLADGPWDAVFHFAALSQVGESMGIPAALSDRERWQRHAAHRGVRAARRPPVRAVLHGNLFGASAPSPIAEDAPINPASPYGESKCMIEHALHLGGPRARPAQRLPAVFQRRGGRSGGPAGRGSSAGNASRPPGHRHGPRSAAGADHFRRGLPDARTAPAFATTSTSPISPMRICVPWTGWTTAASSTISATAPDIRCWR